MKPGTIIRGNAEYVDGNGSGVFLEPSTCYVISLNEDMEFGGECSGFVYDLSMNQIRSESDASIRSYLLGTI